MIIPPKYLLSPKISELLADIEASKEVIDSLPLPTSIETNIRRQSLLKSALFSARIEGNTLNLDDLTSPSKTQKKVEVFNILKALNEVYKTPQKDIFEKDILNYHAVVMDGLSGNKGNYRTEVSAIFNAQGIAIYMPPPPRYIKGYITKLLSYVKSEKERFIPIKAVLSHYIFEKIHPFLDGNGRVGRLILQKVLLYGGYGMKGLVNIEEYLDNNRQKYYQSLEEPERELTPYVEFMLEAIADTSKKAKELILNKQSPDPIDFMLPRRAEIYHIIKDHTLVNFDQIRRRFFNVNERTLRYDLKKLQDLGFIVKLGTTKGVYYKIV